MPRLENLTWGEFLQLAKEAGVEDTDEIDYFDFNGFCRPGFYRVERKDRDGKVVCIEISANN